VVQLKSTALSKARDPDLLGIPVWDTVPELQQDAFKELVNKLSWVLGSTYRRPYTRKHSPVRNLATALAREVITNQGYPESVSK